MCGYADSGSRRVSIRVGQRVNHIGSVRAGNRTSRTYEEDRVSNPADPGNSPDQVGLKCSSGWTEGASPASSSGTGSKRCGSAARETSAHPRGSRSHARSQAADGSCCERVSRPSREVNRASESGDPRSRDLQAGAVRLGITSSKAVPGALPFVLVGLPCSEGMSFTPDRWCIRSRLRRARRCWR